MQVDWGERRGGREVVELHAPKLCSVPKPTNSFPECREPRTVVDVHLTS